MMVSKFAFVALLLLGTSLAQPTLSGYAYSVDLSSSLANSADVFVYYKLYYSVNGSTLRMGAVVDVGPSGWAGIGFSNSGLMQNSDAAVAWVDGVGTGYVTDFWLNGRVAPSAVFCNSANPAACPDSGRAGCVDNLSQKSASRSGNYLTFQFERPLAASDNCDFAINPNNSVSLVFAHGPVTSSGTWPFKIQFHAGRTNGTFNYTLTPYVPPLTTAQATTGVATTGASATTGSVVIPPPTLTGYDQSVDLSNSLTDGIEAINSYFKIYYTIEGGVARFGVVAESEGWVGIGWSFDGTMFVPGNHSDAVIGWVDSGNFFLTDFDLKGRIPADPTICTSGTIDAICPDSTQSCSDNLSQTSGSRTGPYVTLQFSRPVAASDVCDVAITPNVPQFFIYSKGPVTNSGVWPYKVQFHSARTNGTKLVTFIPRPTPTSAPSAGTTASATTAAGTTAVATTSAGTTGTCIIGKEGCSCTAGGGCDPQLECRSRICVLSEGSRPKVLALLVVALVALLML